MTPVPAIGWLRAYQKAWLRPDIIAGLTVAAVVVPKAMAYAAIAGLPLQVGLYTAIVPMVVYALLGTSRVLSVSTTTTIAILAASELGRAAPGGDTGALLAAGATLAMLVGLMLIVASIVRLGFIANFISEPVLTGFKSGIGLVIVIDQIPKLLGVHVDKSGFFFRDLFALVAQVPHTSLVTLLLAVFLLVLIFGVERFAPQAPALLIAIGFAIGASAVLGLQDAGVATVGGVSGGLPTLVMPNRALVEEMWPAAAGIALMSFTETVAAARAFATTGEPRPEPNQELLAIGAGNLVGGLLGAMPSGGGTSQTAVNRKAGACTQVAELITAAAALATLLLLAPVIAKMPQAALAAVVVVYSLDLIKPVEFVQIRKVRVIEYRWAVVAFLGVLFLGTLKGILAAVIVSIVALAQQVYNPPVYVLGRKRGTQVFRPLSPEHPEDETWTGLLIVRLEGRLFYANAETVSANVRTLVEQAKPRVVVLDCSALFDIEYTALKMMTEAEQQLREAGVTLWLASLNPGVLDMIQHSELGRTLGRERMLFNLEAAVVRYEQLRDQANLG